jgi:acyl-CoA hydrolase
VLGRGKVEPAPLPGAELAEADLALGREIEALMPEGAWIQFGPGRVGQALIRSLKRPVSIWSGLLNDEIVDLDERGLVETAKASYLIGTERLFEWSRGRGMIDRVEVTHRVATMSAAPFVAVNTALEIDLSGAVNVETVRSRTLGAVGGHPDFALAAATAPRGLSLVAVPSRRGSAETLVERLAGPTTTARYDIDVVVTERGSVDLRGRGPAERALLLTELWSRPSNPAGTA